MTQATIAERSMARALGLLPKAKRIERTPGMVVTLTVRPGGTGTPQRFTHTSRTISRCLAIIEAEQEARQARTDPDAGSLQPVA